jgi:ParB family chromosome partitioning protein
VREAESLARRMSAEFNLTSQKSSTGAARGQKRSDDPKSADLRRVEEDLSDALMAQVEVRFSSAASRSKGGGPPKRGAEAATAGEVAIRFASIDELNGLLEKLQRAAAGVNAAAQA